MRSLNCCMWDQVPWEGIKPRPQALGVWTTREVPLHISDVALLFSGTALPVLLPQLSGPAAADLSLTFMRTVGTAVLDNWLCPWLLPLTLRSAWCSSRKVKQDQERNWGQVVTVSKSFQQAWEYQKRSEIDRVTYTAISSGYSERSTV